MKRIFLILICSVFYVIGNAQNFNPKILSLPENPSNDDFSFLKEELKVVQVLMLGEKSHYDGNVFEMKTKIIEYLYKELGFTTIAFESGVYDVWKAQNKINKGTNVQLAFKNSLFSIWSNTNEFQSFVQFYEANKSNLKLFGFDSQISGKYGDENLFIDLFEYCSNNQLELKLDRGDLELLIESINYSNFFDENDITYSQYKSSFENLLKAIAKKPKTESSFYWSQIIKSLLASGEKCYLKKPQILNPFHTSSNDNIRDKQMADNLLEYIKNHPNEKIICWGANQHFVNDMSSVTAPIIKDFVPMGSYVKKELKEKMYSFAAVTAADSVFLGGKWNTTIIDKKSFEYYLRSKNKAHMFISSKQDEMEKSQLNRLFSPEVFVEAKLNSIHDGYFYFNNVSLSTSIAKFEVDTKNKSNFVNNTSTPVVDSKNEQGEKGIVLNEIIVRGRKYPYTIVKHVIENFGKNYPSKDFNSKLTSNIDVKVQDTTILNLDFVAKQYDLGYDKENRNFNQIQEIRWNIKTGYSPKGLRGEFYYVYLSNPIKFSQYLNEKKFKKFVFKADDDIMYNNREVYVINFSTLRDQYSYTHRNFLCDFSGTLYIDKEDYAIVKIIEKWDVKKYESSFDKKLELIGWPENYVQKESTLEITETDLKKSNGLYYISEVKNKIYGNLTDKNNRIHPFQIIVNSFLNDFNGSQVEKFTYKQEKTIFDKVEYNKTFWDKYESPLK
ncbi:erythromycin esterase family protein [Flavobacterium psychroterrae]|uniref:Erythromycin esterase family protein n=1 Tax=Flavobacterium psychroterrae TaxID=2133767 RepID=A0ABS5PHV6_9FLAO|nr:erythromycin esterase family protein [Flavobacterium psychroterrae]MBS7233874.1 erythromycin esterase family protein [Flavobacterium psychroterrae]